MADSTQPDRGGAIKVFSCAAIVAVCLVAGLPTISSQSYFIGDDFGLVQHLHDVPVDRLLSYFVSDWTESIYGFTLDELRPLLAFTYWLDSQVFGAANAPAYHATNIALHVLNSLLVFAIAISMAARTDLALLAASLFALMPSHAEPIAWVSGRVDSLAAAFYLGAFLCFVHFRRCGSYRWYTAALVLFGVGLFAKQSMVTFPVLVLAYDTVFTARFPWRAERATEALPVRQTRVVAVGWIARARLWLVHVPFVIVLALYLSLRRMLFGNAVREDLLTIEIFKSFVDRQSFYIGQMLPVPPDMPRDGKTAVAVFMWGVLAGCAWWLLARWRSDPHIIRRLIFFGAIWYAITIAPMIVTYESARHLYVTAAGISIAIASLLLPAGWRSSARSAATRGITAGVLVALCAVSLTSNTRSWIANGVDSRRFASTLPALLQSLPQGSTVMVDIRHTRRGIWFWSWALPFALQPPFVGEDLYKQFAVVEWPIVYCCLPHQWWAAKQAALGPILRSTGTHEVTYIVPDSGDPESLIAEKRVVSGPELRRRIEAAIGRPLDTLSTSITQDEAQRVAEVLFE